jgi:Spy/CpxP family protein refolding chaperone
MNKEWKMRRSLRKNNVTLMMIAVGLLVILTGAEIKWAHAFGYKGHHAHGGRWGGLKLLMQLDLSDIQKSEIKALLPSYREERDAYQAELQAMRQQMHVLMEADSFNEDDVRRLFNEMAPIIEEMAVLKAKFMFEIKSVLTAAQISLIKEKHAERKNQFQEHRQMRASFLDIWLQASTAKTGSQTAQKQPYRADESHPLQRIRVRQTYEIWAVQNWKTKPS